MAIKLRPVRVHRRIQIEPAFSYQLTGQNRDQALRTREDHRWCVVLPWSVAIIHGTSAPKIRDDLAIEAYLQCTTMIMRCREHLGECVTKWLES
jgi:hypothetical protein